MCGAIGRPAVCGPWPSGGAICRRAVAGAFVLAAQAAQAEVFAFQDLPGVGNFSVSTLHTFFVYSRKDAPDKSLGDALVRFENIKLDASGYEETGAALVARAKGYESLELVLVPRRAFWEGIQRQQGGELSSGRFCCTSDDERRGKCRAGHFHMLLPDGSEMPDVYAFPVGQTLDLSLVVRQSGAHLLVLANCGGLPGALFRVSGTVLVRNPFGFLPGGDYHKLPLYGWLVVAYFAAGATWLFSVVRGVGLRMTTLHLCIAIAVLVGILESFLWWFVHHQINGSGATFRLLSLVGLFASAAKGLCVWTLALLASYGWGVTKVALDRKQVNKIALAASCYVAATAFQELGLRLILPTPAGLSPATPPWTTQAMLKAPIALWNGAMCVWILSSLQRLTAGLGQRQQKRKAALFQRLFVALVAALCVAGFAIVLQVANRVRTPDDAWRSQWFYGEGVFHVLFLVVLVAVMWFWSPGQADQGPIGAAAKEFGLEEGEEPQAPGPGDWTEVELAEVGEGAGGEEEEEEQDAGTLAEALQVAARKPRAVGAGGSKAERKQKVGKKLRAASTEVFR